MKKTLAPDALKAALAKRAELHTEISNITRQIETNGQTLTELEIRGDITNPETVIRIAEHQALQSALPRRLAARETDFNEAETQLLAECHTFIRASLGPRLRAKTKQAEEKTRAALAPLISESYLIDRAVAASDEVRACSAQESVATLHNPPYMGVLKYAEQLLAAWEKCEKSESKNA